MNYAIIVAGGMGSRMESDIPKQFLPLAGLPVMMHTINAFRKSKSNPHIIVVLHPSLAGRWSNLCSAYNFTVPHFVVNGGKSRFESVKNGLDTIQVKAIDKASTYIAVHDAARPLISPELIDRTYLQAAISGAAALSIQGANSIRLKSANGLKTNAFPREKVYLMQTPQTFSAEILFTAYRQQEDRLFTDDASVVEKAGYPIELIEGDTRNLKITYPEDLKIAAMFLPTSSGSTPDNAQ